MNDELRQQWQELLQTWAVDTTLADRVFAEVCRHYAGPGRFYHTLEHVQNVLETVERLESFAHNPRAVKLAAWLHDVIHDSRAKDNEEKSADYAAKLCDKLAIPDGH